MGFREWFKKVSWQNCGNRIIRNNKVKIACSSSNEYSSAIPNPVCRPAEAIQYPKSVDDVVKIVKYAMKKGLTVKAFGHRHSATDIICTDGIPVDMQGLQSFKMNDDDTATFAAGIKATTKVYRLV